MEAKAEALSAGSVSLTERYRRDLDRKGMEMIHEEGKGGLDWDAEGGDIFGGKNMPRLHLNLVYNSMATTSTRLWP